MGKPATVRFRRTLPVPARTAFHWHTMRGAFERLAPPWQQVRLLVAPDALADGTQAVVEMKQFGFARQWVAEHFDVKEGRSFSDTQLIGPFKEWTHHHRFISSDDSDTSILEDEIHYRVPLGVLGAAVAGRYVKSEIERLFAYRQTVTAMDADRYWRDNFPRERTILVVGHTGLIGKALVALLRSIGYTVRGLTRRPEHAEEFFWNPAAGALDEAALEGVSAVIHLAGAGIFDRRWSPSWRKAILESRREGTALLARTMASMARPPNVLVSASGINAYAADGSPYGEEGPAGDGFLSEVCRVWERAADPAREAGIRVVHPRIGVVLTPQGGALKKMLPAFRMGVGGPVGSGDQMFSWVGLHDVLDILVRSVEDASLEGPVNVVAPEAVSQKVFAQTLGRVLRRPAILPLPAPALRLIVGKALANETVLANLHVVPQRLQEHGYVWRHAGLEDALRYYLGMMNA
jgi:uncharacterized protein (TIGR01777 family)